MNTMEKDPDQLLALLADHIDPNHGRAVDARYRQALAGFCREETAR